MAGILKDLFNIKMPKSFGALEWAMVPLYRHHSPHRQTDRHEAHAMGRELGCLGDCTVMDRTAK